MFCGNKGHIESQVCQVKSQAQAQAQTFYLAKKRWEQNPI